MLFKELLKISETVRKTPVLHLFLNKDRLKLHAATRHSEKVGPRTWGETQNPGPCGGTLGWDPRVGSWDRTLAWDPVLGS